MTARGFWLFRGRGVSRGAARLRSGFFAAQGQAAFGDDQTEDDEGHAGKGQAGQAFAQYRGAEEMRMTVWRHPVG